MFLRHDTPLGGFQRIAVIRGLRILKFFLAAHKHLWTAFWIVWGLGLLQLWLFFFAQGHPWFFKAPAVFISALGVYLALTHIRIRNLVIAGGTPLLEAYDGKEDGWYQAGLLDREIAIRCSVTVLLTGFSGLALATLFSRYIADSSFQWQLGLLSVLMVAAWYFVWLDIRLAGHFGIGRVLVAWTETQEEHYLGVRPSSLRALDAIHASVGLGAFTLAGPLYSMVLITVSAVRSRSKQMRARSEFSQTIVQAASGHSEPHVSLMSFTASVGVVLSIFAITADWSTWTQFVGIGHLAILMLISLVILSGEFVQPTSRIVLTIVGLGSLSAGTLLTIFTLNDPSFHPLVVFFNKIASEIPLDTYAFAAWMRPVYQAKAPFFASSLTFGYLTYIVFDLFANRAEFSGRLGLMGILYGLSGGWIFALFLAGMDILVFGLLSGYELLLVIQPSDEASAAIAIFIVSQTACLVVAAVIYASFEKVLKASSMTWFSAVYNSIAIFALLVSISLGALQLIHYQNRANEVSEGIREDFRQIHQSDSSDLQLRIAVNSPYPAVRYQVLLQSATLDSTISDFDSMIAAVPELTRIGEDLSEPLKTDVSILISTLQQLEPLYLREKAEGDQYRSDLEFQYRVKYWNMLAAEFIESSLAGKRGRFSR